ncbi:MAG: DUF3846 domain-containing protein, partial [Atopobiaceae bacterium]|nr:DUF3846 domain-containing protein [Atopobiaceae bacterium]
MVDGVKVMVVRPGEEPELTRIEPDSSGSYLSALQELVGGYIEAFDPLFGDEPLIWVNEEGLSNRSMPNRAVYANKRMEEIGYISQMDYSTVVKEGDLYSVLFGTFVAAAYDLEGDIRDLSDDEVSRVNGTFGGIESIISGHLEVQRILSRRHHR